MEKSFKKLHPTDLSFYKAERYYYLIPAINTALRATTGQKLKNHKDWSAWWKDNEKGFVALDDTNPPPTDDEPWLAALSPEKLLEGRFAWQKLPQKVDPPDWQLFFDKTPVLSASGQSMESKVEGAGDARALIVRIDGKEFARVPLPKLDLKPVELPPLAFPDCKGASSKVESKSVNGKSTAKVWIDGKLVYDGPGGSDVKAVKENDFVEVTIDGRVIYRAGKSSK